MKLGRTCAGRGRALVLITGGALVVGALVGHRAGPASARPAARVPASLTCGSERWSVKTLTDPQARIVSLHPRATTSRRSAVSRRPARTLAAEESNEPVDR